MPRNKSPTPRKPQLVISAPLTVRREIPPEVQSLLEVISGQTSGTVNLSNLDHLTPISEETRSRRAPSGEYQYREYDTLTAPRASLSPRHLRSSFSSPDLRLNGPTPDPLPPRSKSPEPSRPRSMFSIGTNVVRGKRLVFRRMLDAGGCTKSDKFDLGDFDRVRPSNPQASPAPAGTNGNIPAVVLTTPIPLREERWRPGVQQMLYPDFIAAEA